MAAGVGARVLGSGRDDGVATAAIGTPLSSAAFRGGNARRGRYALAATSLSTASLVISGAFTIPRNDRLARLDPDAGPTAEAWSRYVTTWTRGNQRSRPHIDRKQRLLCPRGGLLTLTARVGKPP
ncbi:MAG: anthrone oxygenase family protein [Acidimicrobiales bacterium]